MVNYQRILKAIESEKKELKKEKMFMPSQLSPSIKKKAKYEISQKIESLSDKEKKIKSDIRESKESRKRLFSMVDKLAKKKVTSRKVLKSKRMSVEIKDYKAPSILNDPNRFFKDTMEETKKSLYFE